MSLYFITLLVFLAAASVLFFVLYLVFPRKSIVKERLEGMTVVIDRQIAAEKPPGVWQKFLVHLGKGIPVRPKDAGKYAKMLIAADIKKERLPIFMGTKVVLTVLLPLAYLVFYGIAYEPDMSIKIIFTVGAAIAGFLLPTFWLRRRITARQTRIFHDLPDLLDLMTVCVEAGLSMDAAMVKVYEDEQFRRSPLAKEMKIAIQETRAGKPRLEALRDMGERSMVDDLKSFAAMLIQTEKLGTSLAQTLRVFSDSLRTIRRQRAEEAAAKTAVKLIFPLVFCIFPALLLVILGPGFLRIIQMFAE